LHATKCTKTPEQRARVGTPGNPHPATSVNCQRRISLSGRTPSTRRMAPSPVSAALQPRLDETDESCCCKCERDGLPPGRPRHGRDITRGHADTRVGAQHCQPGTHPYKAPARNQGYRGSNNKAKTIKSPANCRSQQVFYNGNNDRYNKSVYLYCSWVRRPSYPTNPDVSLS
jgi:hypothetical protein